MVARGYSPANIVLDFKYVWSDKLIAIRSKKFISKDDALEWVREHVRK
jgi:hypothetical protein